MTFIIIIYFCRFLSLFPISKTNCETFSETGEEIAHCFSIDVLFRSVWSHLSNPNSEWNVAWNFSTRWSRRGALTLSSTLLLPIRPTKCVYPTLSKPVIICCGNQATLFCKLSDYHRKSFRRSFKNLTILVCFFYPFSSLE